MNLRFVFAICLLPFVLSACQTSQVATSSFAGQSLNGEPVKKAVKVEDAGVPTTDVNEQFKGNLAEEKTDGPAVVAISDMAKAKQLQTGPTKRSSKRITVAEGRRKYRSMIARHAKANGVPVKLAMAVVEIESSYRVNARGRAGEIGLMQLLPTTARYIGYKGPMKKLYHPDTNIKYGMKYLGKAHKLGGGKLCGTILKYNAGHGAKRMNKVSRTYCNRISRLMRKG